MRANFHSKICLLFKKFNINPKSNNFWRKPKLWLQQEENQQLPYWFVHFVESKFSQMDTNEEQVEKNWIFKLLKEEEILFIWFRYFCFFFFFLSTLFIVYFSHFYLIVCFVLIFHFLFTDCQRNHQQTLSGSFRSFHHSSPVIIRIWTS